MNSLHIESPQIESVPLSKINHGVVMLKMEALQPSHSFKVRGIGYLCQNAARNGFRSLVSSSGGNAGLATAYAGRKLGLAVTIFVPSTTSNEVISRLELEGARVRVSGCVWDEAHAAAIMEAERTNARLVHPFDDPELWVGHSSMIQEVHKSSFKPDAVVLSVGGGGLLCGVLEGLHRVKWVDVPVIAVETTGAASFAESFNAKKIVELQKIETLATSLGARRVSQAAFDWISRHEIYSSTVTDRSAVNACLRFADDHKVLVEPACGASLSVVYENLDVLKHYRNILVIVCGGFGVTIEKLLAWQRRVER